MDHFFSLLFFLLAPIDPPFFSSTAVRSIRENTRILSEGTMERGGFLNDSGSKLERLANEIYSNYGVILSKRSYE